VTEKHDAVAVIGIIVSVDDAPNGMAASAESVVVVMKFILFSLLLRFIYITHRWFCNCDILTHYIFTLYAIH
jgi:hypothetical protein